jgi:hypothetical protein
VVIRPPIGWQSSAAASSIRPRSSLIARAVPSRAPPPAPPICTQFDENHEEEEIRPGSENYNTDLTQGRGTPYFPFPVRIPSFLLPEHLHLRGKEFIEGIATSSHVDLIQQLLLYLVHMEHGFSIDINVGFVEIILPPGQDHETPEHTNCNNEIDREEDEEGGRPSSCDEFEDDENNPWAPELLHSQSEDIVFPADEEDLQYNVQESDIDVEEAARLLMGYTEVRGGESRSQAHERREVGVGRRGNCRRGERGSRARAVKGKRPVNVGDRGLAQRVGRQARVLARAAAREFVAASSGTPAAAAAAYAGSPQAAAVASAGTPQAVAGASSSWGTGGARDPAAGSSHGGYNIFPTAPTNDMNDFVSTDSAESDVDGLEEGSDGDGDPENIRFAYRGSTWSKNYQTYNPEVMAFEEDSIGLTGEYSEIPSYIHLFEQFWTFHMLRDICLETNRYAGSLDENRRPRGGRGWYPVTVKELKVFLAISLYMGMKKLPNVKAYWAKSEEIFYCNVIAGLFTRKRFMTLTRCLHITDPSMYVADNTSPHFDKMHQTRWLIDAIRGACKRLWSLGQFVTIDETMVRYKGTYCPARQYMPKKPVKWGVKVWCAADSKSKFIFDFDIYCGKSQATLESRASTTEEQNLAHRVVTQLTTGLENKGHVVVMDNYFTSVGLFRDLERRGIYATGTMRSNRIGLHPDMRKTKEFKRRNHGDLDWFMHESRRMSSILWKDKMPVLLLSTHAPPIFAGDPQDCTVPRRSGAIRYDIRTSPILQNTQRI